MGSAAPDGTCSLGIDFGNYSSKEAIVRKNGDIIQVFRVQLDVDLNVDLNGPETSADPIDINNIYEFYSSAALIDGRLVVGNQARAPGVRKQTFYLKTMLMYCAGITNRRTIYKAPGGKRLLKAIRKQHINCDMMQDCIKAHFMLLRDMALKRARLLKALIHDIVLTHPNFFSGWEYEIDFRKFCLFYLEIVSPIWVDYDVVFHFISEGRAVALYACESFRVEDSDCLFNREALFEELQDLAVDGVLNLKFFDSGGSTVNIEDVTVYLRSDNTVCSTQANVSSNTVTGVLGGSNLCNSEVQDAILAMMPNVEPEQLEEFMRKLEIWKWRVSNLQVADSIELVGTNRQSWVTVPAEVLTKSLMLSYKPGVDALRRATKLSVAHKKNQGFIFCGGGYRNPGVRREIQKVYTEFEGNANKAGIKMKYIYLSKFDKTWVSAVAVGAALSVQRVPHPLEVWQGSALGLHVHTNVKGKWIDSPKAQVLVSNKWGVATPVSYPGRPQCYRRRSFNLVCDPNYSRDNEAARARHRPIEIWPEEQVFNGPLSSYNLDFSVTLPPYPVDFWVFGPNLDYLSCPFNSAVGLDSITFGLCYSKAQIETAGSEVTQWHITLKVNPASKLLYTYRAIRMPFRCSMEARCQLAEESTVVTKVHQCMTCKDHIVCDGCWMFGEMNHIHSCFEEVDLIQEKSVAQGSGNNEIPPYDRRRSDTALLSGDNVTNRDTLQSGYKEAQPRKRARVLEGRSSERTLDQSPEEIALHGMVTHGSRERSVNGVEMTEARAVGDNHGDEGDRAGDMESGSEEVSSGEKRGLGWKTILQSTASEAERLAQLSSSVIPHEVEDPELFTYIGPAVTGPHLMHNHRD